ncbi:hypothetical protein ACQ86D_28375 [Streptomyces galilaeus]
MNSPLDDADINSRPCWASSRDPPRAAGGSAKQEQPPAVLVVRLAGVSGGVGVEHSSLSEAKSRQLIHHIAREI